jgi:hypothetical protein
MSRRSYSIGILGIAAALLAASVGSAQTDHTRTLSAVGLAHSGHRALADGRSDRFAGGPGRQPGVYSRSVSDPTLTTEHEMRLTGLLPGHHYVYGVGQPSALLTPPDATYAFGSAPVTGSTAPVRVWVVGDSGHNNHGAQAVRDKFESYSASRPPDLWLMLGDNAYSSGTDAEYQDGCFNLFPVRAAQVAAVPDPREPRRRLHRTER